MALADRVTAALEQAWSLYDGGESLEWSLPTSVMNAVDSILAGDSAPNRQILLTIAAATANNPDSNPASIQQSAGVDRRSQAKAPRDALALFKNANGLTLKISQDPGVSNQWREPEINEEWVCHRRAQDQSWATGFLTVVSWLAESALGERGMMAQGLLEFVALRIVERAASSALNYPRFHASPRLAMGIVLDFLNSVGNRPDAMEAVVTAAARVLAASISTNVLVERGDINSPDAIDILITSEDGVVRSGIEVTDELIGLAKLEHEVLPAMLKHGLDRATVISRGVDPANTVEIDRLVKSVFLKFGQRIDLLEIEAIETWLSFPAATSDLSTLFLWEVGAELDTYSADATRRAWYDVLTEYTSALTDDGQD